MREFIVVLCTFSNEEEARHIGTQLLIKQYIACINFFPKVNSLYRWEGKIHEEKEVFTLMKTRYDLFEKMSQELKALHSYEEPEIISLPINDGSPGYLSWLASLVAD